VLQHVAVERVHELVPRAALAARGVHSPGDVLVDRLVIRVFRAPRVQRRHLGNRHSRRHAGRLRGVARFKCGGHLGEGKGRGHARFASCGVVLDLHDAD
jgi:hypothetical protein